MILSVFNIKDVTSDVIFHTDEEKGHVFFIFKVIYLKPSNSTTLRSFLNFLLFFAHLKSWAQTGLWAAGVGILAHL